MRDRRPDTASDHHAAESGARFDGYFHTYAWRFS
jgi:hypothetical protein